MKLTEIQLTKKAVKDFFKAHDIEFSDPQLDFKIVKGRVQADDNAYIHLLADGSGEFKLPFEFDRLFSVEVSNRTITNWSDLGNTRLSTEWYFNNCHLPPIAQMPRFDTVIITISPTFDFKDNIFPLFECRTPEFSIESEDGSPILRITKGKNSSFIIRHDKSNPNMIIIADAFELQDWLVNNGFENLV